ncbi:hypothetical protein TTHERM_000571588 (macronuclear) [Tetrahymena thermophila SB210]|uniref:Uncharacterized protein n=1 Tax=Tetrahymena thermophila (strain SB210) TaxID=312017 RepID=W7XH05_TETTS|nr:hypothetical protein TTHERM_000571588 [Tetrahymena thermophila SB210]EWS72284.1 hypothetical protein TTHERM_000571588 [Tetrahymena thermophila SB210]|eukprot:XP_012655224.1 hypothetical protein TTHERM_000571588 [Tetrahymena thermophila SB210]
MQIMKSQKAANISIQKNKQKSQLIFLSIQKITIHKIKYPQKQNSSLLQKKVVFIKTIIQTKFMNFLRNQSSQKLISQVVFLKELKTQIFWLKASNNSANQQNQKQRQDLIIVIRLIQKILLYQLAHQNCQKSLFYILVVTTSIKI